MYKAISFTIFITLIVPFGALADQDAHGRSVDEVLEEIIASQNIKQISDVECDSVTDEQFEALGEAVMSVMHPDSEQHELMDEMMGGEGSESLEAAHIHMGQSYLGCGTAGPGMMGSGMMGRGMMGNFTTPLRQGFGGQEGGGFNMMGLPFTGAGLGSGGFILGWIIMIAFWALIIGGIIWLVKSVLEKGSKKESDALDILKKRYAKGEINKDEFERIRKELI